ncbi:MAG: arylsulfatase [bacterium]
MNAQKTFLNVALFGAAALAFPLLGSAQAPASQALETQAAAKPNIVIVLADDFGFGDAACYDPQHSKIPTPNIDRLAREGMRFTEAHSPSAVCTPTRYGLLTGRYNWRSTLQAGVLRPFDPPLIAPSRLTLASLLKQQGYQTACIGKWHLGWNWPRRNKEVAFDQPIAGGPTTRGFDTYFGTDVPNYPPFAFIENDRLTAQPTAQFEGSKEMYVRWGGAMVPGWQFEQILPTLAEKAVDYIGQRAKTKQPFFLYFPLTTPHEPLAPSAQFKGKSGISAVGDLIMESDWALGQVLDALATNGLADNTLIIFTADNGHCGYTGVKPFIKAGHRVSGPFRGYKFDAWDGGHHEPFVARWPGVVKPGSQCAQVACLTDIMATCAEITGAQLPPNAAEDSFSLLPLLKGSERPVREAVVSHSGAGIFAIRRGDWKLILGQGRGTAAQKNPKEESGQLYNMAADIGETANLYAQQPEIVAELTALLKKCVDDGRSTPGPKQKNDVNVDWNKTKATQKQKEPEA